MLIVLTRRLYHKPLTVGPGKFRFRFHRDAEKFAPLSHSHVKGASPGMQPSSSAYRSSTPPTCTSSVAVRGLTSSGVACHASFDPVGR